MNGWIIVLIIIFILELGSCINNFINHKYRKKTVIRDRKDNYQNKIPLDYSDSEGMDQIWGETKYVTDGKSPFILIINGYSYELDESICGTNEITLRQRDYKFQKDPNIKTLEIEIELSIEPGHSYTRSIMLPVLNVTKI